MELVLTVYLIIGFILSLPVMYVFNNHDKVLKDEEFEKGNYSDREKNEVKNFYENRGILFPVLMCAITMLFWPFVIMLVIAKFFMRKGI